MIVFRQGKYHHYNAMKLRIMLTVWRNDKITCTEIADILGVPAVNVSRLMNNYLKKGCKYFRRLKPENGTCAYRYSITKKGLRYMLMYSKRLFYGYDLVLDNRHKIQRTARYYEYKAWVAEQNAIRNAEFQRTGEQQPEIPKPTWRDYVKAADEYIINYMGITKHGAVDLGLTPEYLIQKPIPVA